MSLWDISNELDTISYRLSSIKDVAEIVAERVGTDPESGAIWAIAEMLEAMEDRIDRFSSAIMQEHRTQQQAVKPTKEKKK
jgi:hypothetical protein